MGGVVLASGVVIRGFELFWLYGVFFFNDTATTEIYTLSLHDALPIRCGEVPGFVGNRIAISSIGEVWRAQEEEGLTTEEVDKLVQESGALPMGPFFLTDMLGLDTVLKVAQHLRDSYGERFYVHKGMEELVAAGNLGQKTGKGFYEHGS